MTKTLIKITKKNLIYLLLNSNFAQLQVHSDDKVSVSATNTILGLSTVYDTVQFICNMLKLNGIFVIKYPEKKCKPIRKIYNLPTNLIKQKRKIKKQNRCIIF